MHARKTPNLPSTHGEPSERKPVNTLVDEFQSAGRSARAKGAALVGDAPARRRPDVAYDGHFIGANGQNYHPAMNRLSDVAGVKPSDGRRPIGTIVYVNGMLTDKTAQSRSMQQIADQSGAQVIGIHNATEGFIKDLSQSIGDKLGKGSNPAVDTLADTLYSELKAGRTVHLMAHSQGGIITSRALVDVKNRLRLEDGLSKRQTEQLLANVSVETFGSGASRYPNGPQYVHYINKKDPVPMSVGMGPAWNPLSKPGRNAVVHRFSDGQGNPHSFNDMYLKHRVSFFEARAGQFG